uniref:Kelch-like protein 17 n=1 Tax=Rhizophagus irregularis (strain DAOM 181602 / DAOM 197198 / MUCL 43194) TaxID=747089 RepID=U9TWU5_RHIID
MTNYYWIVAQHSGKVIEVEGGSMNSCAKIIQYRKKSADDPSVDTQLWFFNGGLITNKKSGLVFDVYQEKIQNGTQIIQHGNNYEPTAHQEWDYNHEDNTITLRSNRNFVLDVKQKRMIWFPSSYRIGHQKFTLQKWNDTSGVENVGRLVTNIMADNKFLPKLLQNLLEILNDDEYYDVTIEVGNDPYVKIFRAHMVILNYRSPCLRGILSSNKKKNDGTLTHISLSDILPNILPETFEIILRYIYGGKLSLKECDTSDIIKLLISAKELNLQELVTHIQSFLVENRVNWMEQNIDLIYQTSFENENDSFLCLQKYCNDLISQDPVKILKSQSFESISENLLVSIIQKDNLQMSEIEIWEHVLKWGLAKNPELPKSDPTNYSKEDFNSLKNNLKKFIPYIRFHNLTSKEFLSRVFPYKKVLPKELYVDLLKEYLDNDNKTSSKSNPRIVKEINSKNPDSKIITFKHSETISKWIKRVEIDDELPNSFEFKLLFRGSRDGFYPEKFHEICDNQSYTVTVAKVEGSNEILGGFNSFAWKSNNIYGASGDNFIFSFNNINRNENYILSRIMDKKHATNNKYYCGPSFGNGDLIICGFDLQTLCNYSYNSKNSYEKLIRETEGTFSVEEYEVFRVMFKFKGQ